MKTEDNETPRQRSNEYRPFTDDPPLVVEDTTGCIYYFHSTATRYGLPEWDTTFTPSTAIEKLHDPEAVPSQSHQSSRNDDVDANIGPETYDVSFLWRSRDNRKGRHALLLRRRHPTGSDQDEYDVIEPTNTFSASIRGFRAMMSIFPYWNISWLLAIMFTLGSIVWIINGFIIILPEMNDPIMSQSKHASAWSAFAAGTVYLLASILLMLEAINAYKSGCFGWSIQRELGAPVSKIKARPGYCYHHQRRHNHTEKDEATLTKADSKNSVPDSHQWRWWPSWCDLRLHYFYEIGFIACCIQMVSVTIFWLAKFIAIPEVSSRLSNAAINGAYWAPEILACVGFVVTCVLLMIETQSRWYIPAISTLGWHVGFWKLIGSTGFTVSVVLGPLSQENYPYAQYQSNLASFWGSWALLIGSIVQWYESLDTNPVIQEGDGLFSEYNQRWYENVDAPDEEEGDIEST